MKFRNRALIARILGVLGFVGTLYCLQRLIGAGFGESKLQIIATFIALTLSVFIGTFGFIFGRYYAARDANDEQASERLALETLAKLGQQRQAAKAPKRPKK
jgi:hypothetical protein